LAVQIIGIVSQVPVALLQTSVPVVQAVPLTQPVP